MLAGAAAAAAVETGPGAIVVGGIVAFITGTIASWVSKNVHCGSKNPYLWVALDKSRIACRAAH